MQHGCMEVALSCKLFPAAIHVGNLDRQHMTKRTTKPYQSAVTCSCFNPSDHLSHSNLPCHVLCWHLPQTVHCGTERRVQKHFLRTVKQGMLLHRLYCRLSLQQQMATDDPRSSPDRTFATARTASAGDTCSRFPPASFSFRCPRTVCRDNSSKLASCTKHAQILAVC